MHDASNPGLITQLNGLLRMVGARPARWITGTVAASLALAALDTLGVIAMVPLTQLLTGATEGPVVETVGDVLGTDDLAVLLPAVAGLVAALFIGKTVGSVVFRWWLLGRTTRISALTVAELARRYSLAPYVDHRSRRMSELYRNIGDATTQSSSVLLALVSLGSDVVLLIAITAVLTITSPTVTGFAVVVFGVLVFGVQRLLRRRQYRLGEEFADAGLEAWQFLLPAMDGFREARLTSSALVFNNGFREAKLRQARASREMGILADLPRYLLEIGFVLAIMGISLILFRGSDVSAALTVLGVFAAASLRAIPALNRVAANLATMRIGQAGLRIFTEAFHELSTGGIHEERPKSEERFIGPIDLTDVSYRYPDATLEVLRDLTLRIPANSTVAFVGSSGAGKSTLLDLILGLLTPTRGSVAVGGRRIDEDAAGWYAELGVVPQDVFLLNDTLLANIAFGEPEERIDHDRVAEVVGAAQLGELVERMPQGLLTVVGERGALVSGGQRQRIGLARALYRRPSVLVLDEATSALDNVTEHEIATTLAELHGSITIIIVAHRLSTVRNVDHLVFMKDGQIEAIGRFDEVRAKSAEFARLVELGELG